MPYAPNYYRCPDGHHSESDNGLTECPHGTCGKPLHRVDAIGRPIQKASAK